MLDSSFSGVLVSDFYAAYNHYPGLKQRCWAHLLRRLSYSRSRDIHDLKGGCTQKTLGWLSGPRRFTRSTRRPRPRSFPEPSQAIAPS